MAYSKEELYKKALQAIEDEGCIFIEDISAFIGCNKSTFYKHFPPESDEFNELREFIDVNKRKMKAKMRKQWLHSTNAALQLSLYKLIGTDEERKALSMQQIDHTTQGDKINDVKLIIVESGNQDN